MEHNNKEYQIDEESQFAASEPTINMDLYRTKSFLERHNQYQSIENAVPLHEAFEELRQRISYHVRHITNNHVSGQYFNQ